MVWRFSGQEDLAHAGDRLRRSFARNAGRAKRQAARHGRERKGSIVDGTGIKSIVITEIRELARRYQVERVILFGSRARGDYKRTSDIDLAVSGGDIARFALDVEEETSTLLKYDIVSLDQPVQEDLMASIKREGRVLYEKI